MIDVPVRVKDALRDGRLKKNYRFVVLNDDGSADFTIDNNTLVSESVKFDERMCSGDTLKFGLCEGSSLEFQYFDHPNINGRRIQCFIDVEYMSPTKEFNEILIPYEITKTGQYTFSSQAHSVISFAVTRGSDNTYYELNASNNYTMTLDLIRGNSFFIDEAEDPMTVESPDGYSDYYPIPMGYFTVEKCPRQASTGIYKITAYNKLQSQYLDQKVNDKITEIVTSGVVGGTNGADIGTILDQLLEGYSIKREEMTQAFTITNQIIPSTDTSYIRQSGTTNGIYIHSLDITNYLTPVDFSADNFYRFRINFKNIYDAIYNSVNPYYIDDWFQSTLIPANEDRLYMWISGATDFSSTLYVGGFQFRTANDVKDYSIRDYRNKNDVITPWFTNITAMTLGIAGLYVFDYDQTITWTQNQINRAKDFVDDLLFTQGNFSIEISSRSEIEKTVITKAEAEALSDVTLRNLQSAVFEINTQYGQIDRVTDLFKGVDLNGSRLLPQDSLYPDNGLHPGGNSARGDSSAYSKLWTDNQGAQKFRKLVITYKGLDENDKAVEKTLERTVNPSGNTDYNVSDNWLFKNLIWTAADVAAYADVMVAKMQNVSWFPFEMWGAGLPYLETGDEIEITNDEGTYTSYILQRQLQGIHNLQDTFINGTLDVF